jgi:NAD(P)H-dependent FMN reductase
MVHVLLLSGSTRAGSTNTAVLRTAPQVAGEDISTALYPGMADLPAFDPDDDRDPLPARVADLRRQLRTADALLICTPEYAGALPGAFKNLLDWAVGEPHVQGKPVGWLNVASVAAPTGGSGAYGELATVLGYLGADVVPAACARVPMTRQDVDADGFVSNGAVRDQLRTVLSELARHVAASGRPA